MVPQRVSVMATATELLCAPPTTMRIALALATFLAGGLGARLDGWLEAQAGATFPTAATMPTPGHIVLIWHDATFFFAPREDATWTREGSADAGARVLGQAAPARVLRLHGDFVEVAPLTPGPHADPHCAQASLASPGDLVLERLFVRRADLAPVLGTPLSQVFPDGTGFTAKPGTPVAKVSAATLLLLDGLLVSGPSDLPVRVSYAAAPPAEADGGALGDTLTSLEGLEVGSARVPAPPNWFFGSRGVAHPSSEPGRALFTVETRCGAATMLVRSSDLSPVAPRRSTERGVGFGGGGAYTNAGGPRGSDTWRLPAGTALAAAGVGRIARAAENLHFRKGDPGCVTAFIRVSPSWHASRVVQPPTWTLKLCPPSR